MKAFHFTNSTLRNGEPIPKIGEWLEHPGKIIPCKSGLHASEHPFDALKYAPGNILHLVELEGELVSHNNPVDKWVGHRRKIIASIDAIFAIQTFARLCAFSVIHYWNAPQIVMDFLITGDAAAYVAAARAADAAAYVADAAARAAARAARAAAYVAAARAADAAAYVAAARAADAAAYVAYTSNFRHDFLSLVESEFNTL